MRASLKVLALCLVAVPTWLAGADKLQSALTGLDSKDLRPYEEARAFLTEHGDVAKPALRAVVQDVSRSALARLRAAKLLGDLGDHDGIDVLRKALRREGNARVRVEIIRALSKLRRNDLVVEYFNSGLEQAPSVKAAVALALQGSRDDRSKMVFSELLKSTDNTGVFAAAALAVSETYRPLLSTSRASKTRLSVTWSAGRSTSTGTQQPTTLAPTQSTAQGTQTSASQLGVLELAKGDVAIITALRAREKDSNKAISETASALLQELSQVFYKQP